MALSERMTPARDIQEPRVIGEGRRSFTHRHGAPPSGLRGGPRAGLRRLARKSIASGRMGLVAALAGLLALPGSAAFAQSATATLSVGSGSGAPGASGVGVGVTLSTSPSPAVTAIQFDVGFDGSRLSVDGVSTGGAASSAGKSLSYSLPSSGTLRIVISGGNTPIGNGSLATIIFSVGASASPGSVPLTPGNAVASDAGASSVPLNLNGGSFTITSPPPTNTPIPSNTPANTATQTSTPTITRTPSQTLTPSQTRTPSNTPTRTRTNTPGPSPTASRTPTKTNTPSATVPGAASSTPSPTPSEGPTASGTPGAGPSSTSSPDETATYPPSIETAAAATGTALANLDLAVAGTSTALALTAAPPPSPPTGTPPGGLTGITILAAVVFLGLVIGGVLLIRRWWTGRGPDHDAPPPASPA
jgi:hypothetical protein